MRLFVCPVVVNSGGRHQVCVWLGTLLQLMETYTGSLHVLVLEFFVADEWVSGFSTV